MTTYNFDSSINCSGALKIVILFVIWSQIKHFDEVQFSNRGTFSRLSLSFENNLSESKKLDCPGKKLISVFSMYQGFIIESEFLSSEEL